MRSTAEWEAALEGTTPGPWGYCTPQGRDGHYDPIFGATPGDEIALVKRPADWKIMALAPEAVAEVIRLRRELETLRDEYVADDDPADEYGKGAEYAYQVVARNLTRILEGTHE